jgi:hypothetical protein
MQLSITYLKDTDDTLIYSHDHKATIIRESYKNKLVTSKDIKMQFQLQDIIESHDLLHLDNPFINDEIEAVIKEIPSNRLLA